MTELQRLIDALSGVKFAFETLIGCLKDLDQKVKSPGAGDDEDDSAKTARPPAPKAQIKTIATGGASGKSGPVNRIFVYVLGSAGLLALSRSYGHPVFKIGTTNDADFDKRTAELQGDHYAGTVRTGNGTVLEPGFDNWVVAAIATSGVVRDEGLIILPRTIAVDLPDGMSARQFDAALRRALAPRAIHRRKCANQPARLTAYITGGNQKTPRLSAATELYEFSPRSKANGDALIRMIEAILQGSRKTQK